MEKIYAVVSSQIKNDYLSKNNIEIKANIDPRTLETEKEKVLNCYTTLEDANKIIARTNTKEARKIIGFIVNLESILNKQDTIKNFNIFKNNNTKISKLGFSKFLENTVGFKNYNLDMSNIDTIVISDPTCIIKAFDPELKEKQTVYKPKQQKPTTQHANSNYQNINKPPTKVQAPPQQQKPSQSQTTEPPNSNNQNKPNQDKYNQDQVFYVFNKVYNFFIHIPKCVWLLIGVLLGSFIGWALHGLIERYSFPCIIISFVLLVVAILIIILLTIFLGNKNNKPKQ